MGPGSSFQDEVYTEGAYSKVKNKGLPKMKTRTWIQFMSKAQQQPGAASGRALTAEAELACAALEVQQSNSECSGEGGKQNPISLLLLRCPWSHWQRQMTMMDASLLC